MAAYASTTTIEGTMGAVGHGKLAWGKIDVTNYNSTKVEITAVSEMFSGAAPKKVILTACSDNGYLGEWDETDGAVKCWDHLDASPGELANDVDAGVFDFIAYG